MTHVGGWEIDLKTDTVVWTNEVYHIYELPLDYEPTIDKAIAFVKHEDQKNPWIGKMEEFRKFMEKAQKKKESDK